jgi:glycosyltransferase involved in cell wall biosynthesis
MNSVKPLLSVIVPLRGRWSLLSRVLNRLVTQLVPGEEIIVVHADNPQLALPTLPAGVRWIEGEKRGIGAARNLGAKHARLPYLLFWGADIMPSAGTLARHRNFHTRIPAATAILMGNVAFVPGGATTVDTSPSYLIGGAQLTTLPLEHFLAANTSLSQSLFGKAGGFCDAWEGWGWEEYEFAQRLRQEGAVLYFDCRALGWHVHSLPPAKEKQRHRNAGRQMVLADALHPSCFLLATAFPPFRKAWLKFVPPFALFLMERLAFAWRRTTGLSFWQRWKERRESKEVFQGVKEAFFEHDYCAGGKLWKLRREEKKAKAGNKKPFGGERGGKQHDFHKSYPQKWKTFCGY